MTENNALDMTHGASSADIHGQIFDMARPSLVHSNLRCLDLGCGQGDFILRVKENFPDIEMQGADGKIYREGLGIKEVDFNKGLPFDDNYFNIVFSIEVIEHIENPRLFVREISRILKPGGKAFISTPNIESLRSLFSFVFRGYHASFGPKDYPAHISPIAEYDLKHMVTETKALAFQQTHFFNNGTIPKTRKLWRDVFPFLNGKLISDNYMIIANKI